MSPGLQKRCLAHRGRTVEKQAGRVRLIEGQCGADHVLLAAIEQCAIDVVKGGEGAVRAQGKGHVVHDRFGCWRVGRAFEDDAQPEGTERR